MIDIVVVPTISHCYRLDVTYNGKHASKLRGNDKKIAENFSAKLDIGLNFVTKDECKFCDKIFSNINNLSEKEVNYLLTTLLEAATNCKEDAQVFFKNSNVTNAYKNYGFYPFLV